MLAFDPILHRYALRKIPIPGASECFQASKVPDLSRIPKDTLEHARCRGKAAHKGTELFDFNTLDWSTVNPEVTGYILAWERFTIERKPKHLYIEEIVYSELLWCAGTPDRVSIIDGLITMLDIKTGMYEISADVQTALYEIMHNERHPKEKIQQRMIVKLNSDGTYDLNEPNYFDKSNYEDAKALVRTYHFKKKKGLL